MTTGRINQITILKPSCRKQLLDKVVRFAKYMISSGQDRHTGLFAPGIVLS